MFSSSGSGGAVGLGVASAVRNGEAMLCYRYMYVLCAAGGDEGSHSNCSGLNFKWARWTLLGQAATCGSAAPGPIGPSTGLDDSSRMPLRAGPGAIQIWPDIWIGEQAGQNMEAGRVCGLPSFVAPVMGLPIWLVRFGKQVLCALGPHRQRSNSVTPVTRACA